MPCKMSKCGKFSSEPSFLGPIPCDPGVKAAQPQPKSSPHVAGARCALWRHTAGAQVQRGGDSLGSYNGASSSSR